MRIPDKSLGRDGGTRGYPVKGSGRCGGTRRFLGSWRGCNGGCCVIGADVLGWVTVADDDVDWAIVTAFFVWAARSRVTGTPAVLL